MLWLTSYTCGGGSRARGGPPGAGGQRAAGSGRWAAGGGRPVPPPPKKRTGPSLHPTPPPPAHHVHVEVVGLGVEDLGEGLPGEEGHGGAVDPGVVGGAGHGGEVVLALLGVDAGAGELAVVGVDAVAGHGALHGDEAVGGHLVAQAAGPRVDHDADLPDLVDAHLAGRPGVVDLLHDLDLGVVVAGAEGAHLREPALLGARRDLGRVRVEHPPVLLAVLLVFGPRVGFAD